MLNQDEQDINIENDNPDPLGKDSLKKNKKNNKDNTSKDVDIFDQSGESGETRHPTIFKVLDSNSFGFFVTILTLYALFGDDTRVVIFYFKTFQIAFDKSADLVFDVITIISLFVFTAEITMSWIVKDDYKYRIWIYKYIQIILYSFFFWLDVISTLSLILDI